MTSALRYPETLVVAAYFLLRPIELALWTQPTPRSIAIAAIVSPLIGALLITAHSRARFAAYVFVTMEIVRAVAAGSLVAGGAAAGVLLLLQLPRARAVWPRIDARRVLRRA